MRPAGFEPAACGLGNRRLAAAKRWDASDLGRIDFHLLRICSTTVVRSVPPAEMRARIRILFTLSGVPTDDCDHLDRRPASRSLARWADRPVLPARRLRQLGVERDANADYRGR